MAKKKRDMAKFTGRQRNKAESIEQGLKQQGVPPRQAEERACKEAADSTGGKHRADHSYGRSSKINSSSSPKNRQTKAGPPETLSNSRRGRPIGRASRKER